MTHPTDKELDAPEGLGHLSHHLRKMADNLNCDQIDADRLSRAADAITALRAQLAEAQAELASGSFYKESDIDNLMARADRAEEEVRSLRAAIFGSENYAHDLKCGNFVEMAKTLHAAQKGGLDRADRAEAALAAQIEADAGICDKHSYSSNQYVSMRMIDAAREIRNQPHDRSALDRLLADAEAKALRKAAEVCDKNENVSGWVSRDAILAMIPKEDET